MVGVMSEVNHVQFDTIYEESQKMIHNLGTFGISLYPCSLPGRGYLFEMPEDELELGQGIHGEVSRMLIKFSQYYEFSPELNAERLGHRMKLFKL
jgi:dihydroxyacetone kinase